VAIGLIWLLRLHIWTKYNPSRISPDNYTIWVIIKGLMILIETWGYVMFLFLFIVTGYWFVFFKLQKNVYIFMPPLYTWSVNYYPFIVNSNKFSFLNIFTVCFRNYVFVSDFFYVGAYLETWKYWYFFHWLGNFFVSNWFFLILIIFFFQGKSKILHEKKRNQWCWGTGNDQYMENLVHCQRIQWIATLSLRPYRMDFDFSCIFYEVY